jgi:hypothetical protein
MGAGNAARYHWQENRGTTASALQTEVLAAGREPGWYREARLRSRPWMG